MDQNGNEHAHPLKQLLLNAIAGNFINEAEAKALCEDCFPISSEPLRHENRAQSLMKIPADLRNEIVAALFERAADENFESYDDFDDAYAELMNDI